MSIAHTPYVATTPKRAVFREKAWIPWLLLAVDLLSLQLSLLLGYGMRLALSPWLPGTPGLFDVHQLGLALLLLPLGYYFLGLYPGYGTSVVEQFRRRTSLTLVVFLILLSLEALAQTEVRFRGVVLMTLGFALLVPPSLRFLVREGLVRAGCWGMPVVILGVTKTGKAIAEALEREPALGLVPVGYLDDRSRSRCGDTGRLPLLGHFQKSSWLKSEVCAAILAMPRMSCERLRQIADAVPFSRFVVIPETFGLQSLWISPLNVGDGTLGLEIRRNLLIRRNQILKRALDFLIAVPLTLLCLPLIALLALWVKITSPAGSAFYTQIREGYGGKSVKVWKLRTMHHDAEARLAQALAEDAALCSEWERYYKLKDDPRILPGVGSFLRRTSLDELPQLYNILRGEMSLVGPRPFPMYHLEQFDPQFRGLRHSVLPGLTGLWQVSARSDGDLEVQEKLDSFYIRNWSPWLDLYLLACTPWAVLFGKGAY